MQETKKHYQPVLKTAAAAVGLAMASLAFANDLPSMGEDNSKWQVDVTYENHTVNREHTGLAKFRNTMQAEFDKKVGDGWTVHGIARASWDGVYRMNSSEYGRDAGSKSASDLVMQSQVAAGVSVPTAWGVASPTNATIGFSAVDLVEAVLGNNTGNAALYNATTVAGGPGINTFLDVDPQSGAGLRLLGDRIHDPRNGGVSFAVPVRPCDTDRRGCRDFGGYGNQKLSELEMPEFNDRLDFIRELYAKKTFDLGGGKDLFLKVGKQQVVWGRTDLFRVLDVINPVDFSRNNIYDELSDIRIPMWIIQGEYRMGASETMQDRNLSVVWNIDKFRANNLGQCGSPNVILDAGCFFRGMANLWDNGGTVSNFAHFGAGTAAILNGLDPATGLPLTNALNGDPFPSGGVMQMPNAINPNMWMATNFGSHVIGIRNVNLPDWSLSNTQLGVKYEGVTMNGLSFSLNALTYRSQLPSLRSINSKATNGFTGQSDPGTTGLIAFDMHFPRVNLVGGSMDFQMPAIGAAVRMEGAYTQGEEFANTARPELYSKNDVFRAVIGVDRPTFIPFISETSATLFSAQLFYQHIFNHERVDSVYGKVGMPDWKDNFIGTLLVKGFLKNGTVSPQIIFARDFMARANVAAPQVEWNLTNDFKLTVGANYKWLDGDRERLSFDDCRSCNPFDPFTSYANGQAAGQSFGLGGFEPLGRFRAGPIGMAFKENDIFFKLNYKF